MVSIKNTIITANLGQNATLTEAKKPASQPIITLMVSSPRPSSCVKESARGFAAASGQTATIHIAQLIQMGFAMDHPTSITKAVKSHYKKSTLAGK